jgi:phytanoyl-CoA hydroxylase
MSAERLKSTFDRDGFVVVRGFLEPVELELLRANLDRYIHEFVPALPAGDAFYVDRSRSETLKQLQRMGRDPFFASYPRHAKWLALARELVGEEVEADQPEWFNKPPATDSPTPAHQDNYYFCLLPPHVVTIWLALDPVNEENGCLRYLPGSHRLGLRPHSRSQVLGFSQGITDYSSADRAKETAVCLEAGDVVAHHGETVHRAEANRSASRNRRAFAVVYRGASCRRDEAAFARYAAELEA